MPRSESRFAFRGSGATAFLAFFVRQPLQTLEDKPKVITLLGIASNTHWTRLMYKAGPKTVSAELKERGMTFAHPWNV
jgi:hypothetical protein